MTFSRHTNKKLSRKLLRKNVEDRVSKLFFLFLWKEKGPMSWKTSQQWTKKKLVLSLKIAFVNRPISNCFALGPICFFFCVDILGFFFWPFNTTCVCVCGIYFNRFDHEKGRPIGNERVERRETFPFRFNRPGEKVFFFLHPSDET